MERVVVRRSQSTFSGSDGTRLLRRAWLPRTPRRAVVVVHGLAEHSERYDHVGAWLAARDCAVHAYDQRGHGHSGGRGGHVDAFAELVDDLAAFLALVRREHPDLPLSLVGHSMGGLVTAALLAERKPDVACAVAIGAPLEVPDRISSRRIRVLRVLRRVAPRLRMATGVDPEGLSRDAQVARAYVEDPLVFRRLTVSMAAALLDAIPRTAARAAEVQVPMLLMHGEADPVCRARSSRAFYGQLRGPGHALRLYPQLRHEILNEPEHEQVLEDLLTWLRAREA